MGGSRGARLDAGAANCGRLIALVAAAVAPLGPGEALLVVAYDPSSQVDLAAWCRMTGHRLRSVIECTGCLEFVIEKGLARKESSDGPRPDPQHARQG